MNKTTTRPTLRLAKAVTFPERATLKRGGVEDGLQAAAVIDAASGTFGVRMILPNPNRTIPAGLRCSVAWRDEKQVPR